MDGEPAMMCLLALIGPALAGPKLPDAALQDGPTWRTQGEEVRLTAARELLTLGNTYGALDIIRQMRAEEFDSPELDLLQGKALRMDGVASEAERLLLLAEKKMGRDGRPSAELCILYAELQQVDDAIQACQRATAIDEHDGASWNNLGYLLLSAERPAEALGASEKAVEVDATQARYRNNLGLAQAALGREELAFRTLKSTMPTGDAAYMIGLVRERYGTPAEADAWMARALKLDPRHPQALAWLADTVSTPPTPHTEGVPTPAEVP